MEKYPTMLTIFGHSSSGFATFIDVEYFEIRFTCQAIQFLITFIIDLSELKSQLIVNETVSESS